MSMTREACVVEVLEALSVKVWRKTRYANNTGTCLWCATDELVMVPDDEDAPFFVQGKGDPDALMTKLEAALPDRLAERDAVVPTGMGSVPGLDGAPTAQAALNDAVQALLAEGERRGLERARGIFASAVVSHFGTLPPMVEQRIAHASYADLERWSSRLGKVPSAFMAVS